MDESREAARGDALVDKLCYLGATLRDRVRDALHTGVKRAMAVVCLGFSYDMVVVSHGFVTDISKTDAENEERLHTLIDDAEVPRKGWRSCSSRKCFLSRLAQAWTLVGRAEILTEACEPNLGAEAPCTTLFVLRKCYIFKWFMRSLNVCLFPCSQPLLFPFCLRLYSPLGLLRRRLRSPRG